MDIRLKSYLKYTTLNILGMLGLSLYILADTFFVSKGMGTKGLAALNFAIPVYNFINGTGLMFSIGGGSLYSLKKYQSKNEGDKIFTNSISMAVVTAVIFMVIGILFPGKIASLLGASGTVGRMTTIYIRMILLFSPAFLINNILICFGRNDGRPGLAMVAMALGSLFNIVFDYIFIFPMKLGIFGAVLATGCSPVVGIITMMTHFMNPRRRQVKTVRKIPEKAISLKIISLGAGSLITEMSAGIVMIVFNFLMLKGGGNTAVAAYGIVANISLVVIAVFTGLAQGIQPLASSSYGNHGEKEAKIFRKYGIINVFVISAIISSGIFLFANEIAAIFNSEKNISLQKQAVFGLKIYFAATLFMGINIMMSVYYAAIGREKMAQIIALLRGIVLVIPVMILLFTIFGIDGVWFGVVVTEIITMLVGFMS